MDSCWSTPASGTADLAQPRRRLGALWLLYARPLIDPRQTALAQVRRLGFAAADVRHIVLTHLDLDHAGGLSDFPTARVHVLDVEHAAAMRPPTRTGAAPLPPTAVGASAALGDPRWARRAMDGATLRSSASRYFASTSPHASSVARRTRARGPAPRVEAIIATPRLRDRSSWRRGHPSGVSPRLSADQRSAARDRERRLWLGSERPETDELAQLADAIVSSATSGKAKRSSAAPFRWLLGVIAAVMACAAARAEGRTSLGATRRRERAAPSASKPKQGWPKFACFAVCLGVATLE